MEQYLLQNPEILLLLVLWSLPWKGWAMWRAARNRDLVWFILFLVLNTVGLLEIIYIFLISKKETK